MPVLILGDTFIGCDGQYRYCSDSSWCWARDNYLAARDAAATSLPSRQCDVVTIVWCILCSDFLQCQRQEFTMKALSRNSSIWSVLQCVLYLFPSVFLCANCYIVVYCGYKGNKISQTMRSKISKYWCPNFKLIYVSNSWILVSLIACIHALQNS